MKKLGAQYSGLTFVFLVVDVFLVLLTARLIVLAAWRYRTSQNYPKCSVDRDRQGLYRGKIGIQVKRARLRIRYVLMAVCPY